MNIVLLGYRGSGKSTLGKMLADELWKEFIDTDQAVCKKLGLDSVARIWSELGEPAFREAEAQVVQEAVRKKDHVIALGGGSLMREDTRLAVKQAPDTQRIYLRCEPTVLAQRLASDPGTAAQRPALTAHAGGLQEIQAVLAQREPHYRETADQEFDVTHLGLDNLLRYFIKYCMKA